MAPGIVNSMNEAMPNTEFGLLGPSNGYEVDWPTDTSGDIGISDDDPYTRKSANGCSSGNECGIPGKIKFPFNLGVVGSPDDWTSNMQCDSLPCSPPPAEMSNSNSTEKYYA